MPTLSNHNPNGRKGQFFQVDGNKRQDQQWPHLDWWLLIGMYTLKSTQTPMIMSDDGLSMETTGS